MALKDLIFGFVFPKTKDQKKKEDKQESFATPVNEDGALTVESGGYGTYLELNPVVRNEFELVTRYREMAIYPEVDSAIDDIVNESIVMEENEPIVKLDFRRADKKVLPESIQKKIEEEFNTLMNLLNFDNEGYEIFRKWYIDGRLYYHAVVQEGKEREGIKELRYIDPRQIRKVREIQRDADESGVELIKVTNEYFIYNQRGIQYGSGNSPLSTASPNSISGVKISKDAIVYSTSGRTDPLSSTVLSHLHKAIRPLNQLKMMEDASVIYRITRAPERRIFYIDVQDLPKAKADQYMREMMQRYRNKVVYDAATGDVKDDKKYLTMLEDYWLPRRNGVATTQIETLPGGANLGEIEDIEYFLKKLYKSLNVPLGRLDPNNAMNVGRVAEITRDELKFSKFINRLRIRFSLLFDSMLEKQLVLKGIIKAEDWPNIKHEIYYHYAQENFFSEIKETEIMKERMAILTQIDPFQGKYVSSDWIRRKVLRQSEADQKEIDKEMKEDAKNGIVPAGALGLPGEPAPGGKPGVNAGPKGPLGDKSGNDENPGGDINSI